MKLRHLNISLLILLPALMTLLGLSACTDDYLYNSVKGGLAPGQPVEISLGLQVPEAENAIVGSRATTDSETDQTVYDLYLFIFDQNTNELKSKYYFPQINSSATTLCDPAYSTTGSAAVLRNRNGNSSTSGIIEKIHTTTGPSRIVGVANCNRKGSAMILNKLSKVENISDLREIMVSTVDPDSKMPDFEQSLTVMSGYYCDNNDEHQEHHINTPCDFVSDISDDNTNNHKGYVNIDRERLNGTLWLTPLQSRVKFLVLSEGPSDPNGAIPAGKFELQSWQIYNLPGSTPLFCRGYADDNTPLEPNPVRTLVITRFDREDEVVKDELPATETYDGLYGFNFFVADNHPGRGNAENIKTYGDRARWTGEDYTNHTNPEDKTWTNAPAGATFVVLRGTYSGASWVTEDDGTAEGSRTLKNVTGDVTYTIFLGHNSGSGPDADNTDFNTYRNFNYTYIVRVAGVDKITVEVNKDEEDRPDSEGDIISTTSSTINLDAHYEQRVVTITKQSVIDAIKADNLQISVTVPVFQVTRRSYKFNPENPDDDPNTALPYMEWLEFYEHKPEEVNRRYIHYTDARGNGAEKKTLDAKKFMQRLYDYANDETAPDELTFTVYFSEYLYTQHPVTGAEVSWKDLLRNGQSRRFTMLGTSKFSTDHNSSYTTSGTTFVQRCMQTIYDVNMADLQQGWATECIEEDLFEAGVAGIPLGTYSRNPGYQYNKNRFDVSKFGRQNCWRANSGPGHDTWEYKLMINDEGYLNRPTNQGASVLKNETNLLSACLQRNRDLNGNGLIDREEFVWYIPSLEQMQLLYIGYGALTDDVQLSNVQRDSKEGNVTASDYKNRHYLTSSLNKIWAEEGVSFSALSLGQTTTTSWDYDERYYVRCARSLGTSGEHLDGIPWNIQDYPDYQFESIFEYTPYANEIEETEDGEIAKFQDHKRGRITMRYLNSQSLINVPRFTETPGRVLSFSENNFPTFQFEIADTVINIDQANTSFAVNQTQMEGLFEALRSEPDFSPCNAIGPGWRLPTITELTIMQWAWNENWNKNIAQDFVNDPGFKEKFPNMNENNIGNYIWYAFAGSSGSCNLLSRTQYHYRYVGADGLHPSFNNRVRTYHVYEMTNGDGKFSIDSRDLSTHNKNMSIRCVRSYTTAQANAPAQSPAASRAALKRGVRKK